MTTWEQEPLQKLEMEGSLSAYRHFGLWQSMDTLRDNNYLRSHGKTQKLPGKSGKNGGNRA